MRQKCPVAYSEYLQWSLFGHEDVVRALSDHKTFSSSVSAHVSVPNSMDPPQHTAYRQIVESYFSPEAIARFEPVCRKLAKNQIGQLPFGQAVDCISQLAQNFALSVQCAFLGWPADKLDDLRLWMVSNQQAILVGDRNAMAKLALDFSHMVAEILVIKRSEKTIDVIGSLMQTKVYGRLLKDEEIVSILRNWTGGEVGTIAAAVGIIIYFLATNQGIQQELRQYPEKIPEAIDEILRIHGPLITNRRVTTCPVNLNGREIAAGERLTLFWVSANRDESTFANAQNFQWGRDPSKNLLYGAGIHVCPGAPLARLELRTLLEELLNSSYRIKLANPDSPPHAAYPSGGYSELFVVFETSD